MKGILLYIWEWPQNLLGLLLRAIYKGHDSEYNDAIVRRSTKMRGGISLGRYIIINQWSTDKTVMHEYGHTIQSKKLGWFYLLLVGLPSILHAALCKCRNHSYYDVYPEKWADKLGGVTRK
jgi:hypothetical protein